jgi:DNA-binding LacI/PurR family transcriptional regulator
MRQGKVASVQRGARVIAFASLPPGIAHVFNAFAEPSYNQVAFARPAGFLRGRRAHSHHRIHRRAFMKQAEKTWVTSVDVAKRAGVSRSAVSRTFTPGASVAPETREKVLKAAKELGYQVDILARSTKEGQSNFVGVVIAGFQDPFRVLLLGEITKRLSENALVPLLINAEDRDKMSELLTILLSYKIAGVIMTSGAPPSEVAQDYLQRRVPVAMINRASDFEGVDVVNSDNAAGGALAARALLEGGARRLVYVNTASSTFSGIERGKAFRSCLSSMKRKFRHTLAEWNAASTGYAAGREAAEALLGKDDAPDGVFCATDLMACGFMDVARSTFGLRVPEDIQIVGFDDIPLAGMDGYGLTTIRQDTNELARLAVDSLLERMRDFNMPGRLRPVGVSLVARGSTNNPLAKKLA